MLHLWKFQCFWRPMYKPVEHLRWSFYSKNSKPLSIFPKVFKTQEILYVTVVKILSSTIIFFSNLFFIKQRCTLLSIIHSLDSKLLDSTNYDLTQTLIFGNTSQISSNNFKIINASIDNWLRIWGNTFLQEFFNQ